MQRLPLRKALGTALTALIAALALMGCPNSGDDSGSGRDKTPPAEVGSLNGTGNTQADLTWTDPADPDFDKVVIAWTADDGTAMTLTVPKGVQKVTAPGLTNGKTYTFTVQTVDTSGNTSAGIPLDVTPDAGANLTGLPVTFEDGKAVLTWKDPAGGNYDKVIVTIKDKDGKVVKTVEVEKGVETVTVDGLDPNQEYTFDVEPGPAPGPAPGPGGADLAGSVTIPGVIRVGQAAAADISALEGTGAVTYQWEISSTRTGVFAPVTANGTAASYTPAAGDKDKWLRVTVTRAGYNGTKSSLPVLVQDANAPTPTSIGVTVNPNTGVTVAKGGIQWFTATVTGNPAPSQNVRWTIEAPGKKAGTTIDENGVLTVAADEALTMLTVRATSTVDNTTSAAATVTVSTVIDPGTGTTAVLTGFVGIPGFITADMPVPADTTALDGTGTIRYRWEIFQAGTYTAVPNGDASSYTPVPADAGLYLRVTVTRDGYTGSKSSQSVQVWPAGTPPPTVSSVAVSPVTVSVIKGNTQVFTATVTVSDNVSKNVRWEIVETGRKSGTAIDENGVLTVAADETLTALTVTATSTVDGITSGSAGVSIVDPPLTGTVAITGSATVGAILTANASLNGSGAITYEWKRDDGMSILTGPNNTYAVDAADFGKKITVTVTRVGTTGSVDSNPTAAVGLPPLTGTVTIGGGSNPPEVGEILTADTTNLGGIGTIFYEWKRDGSTVISGANNTYLLTVLDVGKRITVTVTRSGYSGNQVSPQTAAVIHPLTGTVTISGTEEDGQTLTATIVLPCNGSGAITYQWKRSPNITIGTGISSYILTPLDVGKTITVEVRYADNAGFIAGGPTGVIAAAPTYGVALKETVTSAPLSTTHTFTDAPLGYTPGALSVTVTNTGNRPTGGLSASLTTVAIPPDDGTGFTVLLMSTDFTFSTLGTPLSSVIISSIAAGGSYTITVVPMPGLAEGTYTAVVTVLGGNGIEASFDISFTVRPLSLPEQQTMVSLPGGTVYPTTNSYVFIPGRTVELAPFAIAKYETTWQLWREVRDWAQVNGYTFANGGTQGHHGPDYVKGTALVGTSATRATRPVTNINWRDVIIWCNAYSEKSGKTPVYYTDTNYTTVVKESTNENINGSGVPTAADSAEMMPGANGYRLPTEAEWEYAARGGDQYGDPTSWNYIYAGGDTLNQVGWNIANSRNLGSGNPDYGVHPVGTKTANSKGLYDMSGNVWEWCWDWWVNDITLSTPVTGPLPIVGLGYLRVLRGGDWYGSTHENKVTYRDADAPWNRSFVDFSLGFRVAQSLP